MWLLPVNHFFNFKILSQFFSVILTEIMSGDLLEDLMSSEGEFFFFFLQKQIL